MVKTSDQRFASGLCALSSRLHALDCPLMVQISPCGLKASLISDGSQPFGPSEVALPSDHTSRGMTREHIARVADSFAETAARCQRAGADGVQLHAAHGYALCQFLSPFYNKRNDQYSGDIIGRSRIVLQAYDAVRAKAGETYPVWIKINSRDLTEPGILLEESA